MFLVNTETIFTTTVLESPITLQSPKVPDVFFTATDLLQSLAPGSPQDQPLMSCGFVALTAVCILPVIMQEQNRSLKPVEGGGWRGAPDCLAAVAKQST